MKVVAVGGGTGLSTLLRGLKNYPFDITAVVTITDEGGSSGILREELNVPPPGDIRNNLVALANSESILSTLFNYRFQDGSLKGHSVGNIILAALTKITGSFAEAIAKASDILAIKGRVLPVSLQMARLLAVFEDGTHVVGETNIVEYSKKTKNRIVELKLHEPVRINPEVQKVLEESDAVIFGPGSLYTSVIANLVIEGFQECLKKSRAVKIYISNIMTQPGETFGYTLKDHVKEIERYAGVSVDYIIHSFPPANEEVLKKYIEKGAEPVKVDIHDNRVITGHYSSIIFEGEYRIRHDSILISEILFNLLNSVKNQKAERKLSDLEVKL
ncbi:MAG: YvcK family protein [Fervidobacterium sp.]|uniref:gluconeogenesis factor YvcK family protein n=1 Tax=Fervidobacterium TaxID=2422 RepID=UPI0025C2E657|nr:gluconeogenesis factor YvcK family protein [Fervidobacterium sp.]NPU88741.1 YvcK family protein [Fervidobacterium sp.]